MNKTIGNYTTQANRAFPVDCETLDYLAKNQAMAEMLGNIAGDKVILRGCQLSANGLTRGEGYVFLRTHDYPNGEVLRFEGGAVDTDLHIETGQITVSANGYTYSGTYTIRFLANGLGIPRDTYQWTDFITLDNVSDNRTLKDAIDSLRELLEARTGEPLGIVKMWAGMTIPAGYLLCDGTSYQIDGEYAALYKAIGTAFNTAKDANGNAYTTAAGYFRVPDLRGRFIVGHHPADTEYNTYGKSGGEKEHTLKESEMPKHRHLVFAEDDIIGQSGAYDASGNDPDKLTGYVSYKGASNSGAGGVAQSSAKGSGNSHENRPPYYVLAYIIKAK